MWSYQPLDSAPLPSETGISQGNSIVPPIGICHHHRDIEALIIVVGDGGVLAAGSPHKVD